MQPRSFVRLRSLDVQRVLITTDTVGGVWYYVQELAQGLLTLGVEPIVAALGDPPQVDRMDAERFQVHYFPCRLEWMQDPWEDVERSGKWLLALAEKLQPDCIHLNSYAHASLDWAFPVLVVAHSCVYSWYQAVKDRKPSKRWLRYRNAVTLGLAAADGVTAPTADMLRQMQHHYGTFKALPPVANGRRAEDFPPARKEPFFLCAGRLWDEAKNIAALTGIAARLPWPVIAAGEPLHPQGGRMELKNVKSMGCISQRRLAELFSRAAVYVLPALYEPFGLTALEAGLAGCTLVLGDIPSLRENWDGAALFVPPRRADMLERMLRRVAGDDSLRETYSRRARERAIGLTSEKMVRNYLGLYRQLQQQADHIPKRAAGAVKYSTP